jgi:hypothetical protein
LVNEKKLNFLKLHLTTKILIVYLIKIHPYFIFCPKNGRAVIIFSFLLLRPQKTSEALKKGSNFGFLSLKYAYKTRHWVRLVWKKCPVSKEQASLNKISKVPEE